MSHLFPEVGGQDPAATSHSMQSEIDRALIASSYLNKTLDVLQKQKQSFITDVERKIKQKFERFDAETCLSLVEIEEVQHGDGSVTARQLAYHGCTDIDDEDFPAHLSAFMQQHVTDQQQVRARKLIDSGYTEIMQGLVQTELLELWQQQRADMAACYVELHLEVASRRARLCSQAREQLRSGETPLTTQQLAYISSLNEEEILDGILRLAPDGIDEGANYEQALEFVEEHLPQPNFEWRTKPLDPHATQERNGKELKSDFKLANLKSVVRTIVTNEFILVLVDELGLTTTDISTSGLSEPTISAKVASLLKHSSFATRLGGRIATALTKDLEYSFTD
ncbi:hypothetical protein ARSEF1564_010012 [Beauveria bassiana]